MPKVNKSIINKLYTTIIMLYIRYALATNIKRLRFMSSVKPYEIAEAEEKEIITLESTEKDTKKKPYKRFIHHTK